VRVVNSKVMSLVTLRPLAETDVDHIMTWVNRPEIVGNLAAFSGTPMTRDDELAWIRRTLVSADRVWSVVAADNGRYLGQVGIHQIHARSKVGRLGVVIATRDDMGRGFGSAAIRAALDLGFGRGTGELGLHKLWLMVFRTNERGQRLYKKLGFIEEGILREEYFHEGGWHDMVRMSMLAHEHAGR
jgi:[ribosomal protein S5]-alanine N-acetyltransferase